MACADDTVTFTCTLPGSFIRWSITLPQRVRYIFTVSTSNTDSTQGTPAFRGVLTDSSGGMVTATLTSLSEASAVEGTMVECEGESSQEGPLTITVAAGEFFYSKLLIYKWTHRSTLPSTEHNNILHSKPAQLLYYHSGLGPSLLY